MKLLCSLSLVLAFAGSEGLFAQMEKEEVEATPAASAPAATPEKKSGFRGEIESVDASAKTIKVKGLKNLFHVGDQATITTASGTAAKWDDLKVGDEIRGFYANVSGKSEVGVLKISPKTSEKKVDEKKAE